MPPNYLDRLADAMVSLEYYMETLQAGRADPWYMLDNAQTCLQALTQMPKRVVPTVPPLGPEAYAATVLLADAGATARAHALQAGVAPPTIQGVAPTLHQSAQPPIGAKPIYIDPELLALYIEEAREEVARIGKLFPAWEQNPLETDALAGVRRAFHTLKGSGRMVGATDISEFAWSIENLLNRVIENTLPRSPAILATVRDSVAMAGELVNALEAGKAAPARAQDIIDRAHALAANKMVPQPDRHGGGSRAHARYAAVRNARGDRAGPDARQPRPRSALARRARRRSRNWIGCSTSLPRATLRTWCCRRRMKNRAATCNCARSTAARRRSTSTQCCVTWKPRRARTAPHVVSEEAYRACHTLSGSSRMAEARHGIRLTAPLEHWIRKAFDSGVGLDGADLVLLADCMNAMRSVAANLDESTGFFQSHGGLLGRIEQATEQLEQRIIAAARAAELAAAPAPAAPQTSTVAPAVAAPPASFPPVVRSTAAVSAPPAEVAEEIVTDFDQDIASIFTDEAVELIDAAQGGLAQWNENRSSVDGLAALKRPLHTLKGGARMAGLTPMGDLSHELETLFMQIDSGIVAADDRAFSLAQTALDELARMRESVSAGKGVPTAHALIARIHALGQPGGAMPAPVASAAPAAPPPAPAIAAAPAVQPKPAMPAPQSAAPVVSAPPAPPKPVAAAPMLAAVPSAPRPAMPPRAEAPEPPVLAAVWAPPSKPMVSAAPEPAIRSHVVSAPASDPPSIVTRAAARDPVSAGFNGSEAGDGPLLPPGAVPPGREPVAPPTGRNWRASTPSCSTSC